MRDTDANRKTKNINRAISAFAIAYAVFLVWAILWKCGVPFIGDGAERAVNLLPFNDNTRWELEFNVVVFVPFGFCLAAAMRKLTPAKQILAVREQLPLLGADRRVGAVPRCVYDSPHFTGDLARAYAILRRYLLKEALRLSALIHLLHPFLHIQESPPPRRPAR